MREKGDKKSLLFRLFSESKGNDKEKQPEQEAIAAALLEDEDTSQPILERVKKISTDSFDAVEYYNEVVAQTEVAEEEHEAPPPQLDAEGQPMPMDAQVFVDIAPDGMEAFLSLLPPQYGGEEVTADAIRQTLAAAAVNTGIIQEAIENILVERPYNRGRILVASGTPKQDGVDAEIVEIFPRKMDIAPQQNADGTVDFKQLNITRELAKDTTICEMIPATPGEDGISVRGEVHRALPGKTKTFLRGSNTAISEDGLRLVSSVDGNLSFVDDRFQVDNVFVVEGSVDNNTGNISFSGDVLVKGDVREGYEIRCGGSIRIVGTVEGGSVYSENGNILIEGGYNGMKRGEAVATKGSITSKFLQNCTVYAKDKITTEAIINSVVNSDAQVTATKGKGVIVGGRITALHTVEANVIGSDANTPTAIAVGLSPTILAEKQVLEKNMRELEESKEMLKKNLVYLERCAKMGPLSPKNQTLVETCNKQKVLNLVREGKYTKELQHLNSVIEDAAAGSWVKARTVYPSTKVTIQSSSYMTKTEHKRAIFRKEEGEIRVSSY